VKSATCTQAFHMVYGDHVVHIQKSAIGALEIILDGFKLKNLLHAVNWIKISEQGKTLNILLPESQVELVSMFDSMTFSVSCSANKLLIAVFDFLSRFMHRRSKCRASSTAAKWKVSAETAMATPTTIF
jgi:hypothetical protein